MNNVTSKYFFYLNNMIEILYTYIYIIAVTIEFDKRFIGCSLNKSRKILISVCGVRFNKFIIKYKKDSLPPNNAKKPFH